MTLIDYHIDFDSHELARLAAVLSSAPDTFDLAGAFEDERRAVNILYSDLDADQRHIYQQLVDAGVLGGIGGA